MTPEIDPADAGFDAARLARIDRHFTRYVDEGKLPGFLAVIARDGQVVHTAKGGMADIEAGRSVAEDTLWRIYSMTKPITSVAAMLLWEEGAFELKDPVAKFIPAFADARVWAGGNQNSPVTRPAVEPVRLWHLLTHTAGLTYGFHYAHPLDGVYRKAGYEFGSPGDLAQAVDDWARLPLLFEPGTEFNYSVSTDVLGRVVEVISGQPLDAFFKERIFEPLGMTDTAFSATDPDRLAALYEPGLARNDRMGRAALHTPAMLSGGGGLIGRAADYHRFTSMLVREGAPLLAPRTLRYMARNHLPGGAELKDVARPTISETQNDGMGFGLGFSVVLDPAGTKIATHPGELAWGGLASTAFYVVPQERLSVQFFTQMIPSSAYPLRSQLRQLVYQAMTD
ncbi:beta-lactamase family protein [Solirubrobacter sp. CPCC 204708]|nr:beta-lactamase family protein [Solirubrobacter deserti]